MKEETMAEVARQFPVIFDKTEKGHKERDTVENAWREVVKGVDFLSDVKFAKLMFDNLRKRYSKERNDVRKADHSGTSLLADKEKAVVTAFEPYKYLQWIDPVMSNRHSRSNLPENFPDDSVSADTSLAGDGGLSDVEEMEEVKNQTGAKRKQSEKTSSKRKKTNNDEDTDLLNMILLNMIKEDIIEKRKQISEVKANPDELFGQMISAELNYFDEPEKCMIKYDIGNLQGQVDQPVAQPVQYQSFLNMLNQDQC